jgi:hypothetical protein
MYLLFLPYAGNELQVANTSTEMGFQSQRDMEPFVRFPFCHITIYGIVLHLKMFTAGTNSS